MSFASSNDFNSMASAGFEQVATVVMVDRTVTHERRLARLVRRSLAAAMNVIPRVRGRDLDPITLYFLFLSTRVRATKICFMKPLVLFLFSVAGLVVVPAAET